MARKYTCNENFFDEYNLLSCYWAGFISADGCIHSFPENPLKQPFVRLNLAVKDKIHLEKLKNDISSTYPIVEYNVKLKSGKIYRTCYFLLNSRHLVNSLENNFNIVSKKSLILKPPTQIKSLEHKLAFIMGCYDGDGTITFAKRDNTFLTTICGGSKEFLLWIKEEFSKLLPDKIEYKLREEKKNRKNIKYVFQPQGRNILSLFSYLRKFKVPMLERKWKAVDVAVDMEKYQNLTQIKLTF